MEKEIYIQKRQNCENAKNIHKKKHLTNGIKLKNLKKKKKRIFFVFNLLKMILKI